MKRLGVFMDVSNLYYSTMHRFNGRKLSYQAYWDYVKDLGSIDVAIAYGAQLSGEATGFITCLRDVGYVPKFKRPKTYSKRRSTPNRKADISRKADWDVGITVDIVNHLPELDIIILGSADGDFVPLVNYVHEQGKKIIITASGISMELAKLADEHIEITESMLEVENERNN